MGAENEIDCSLSGFSNTGCVMYALRHLKQIKTRSNWVRVNTGIVFRNITIKITSYNNIFTFTGGISIMSPSLSINSAQLEGGLYIELIRTGCLCLHLTSTICIRHHLFRDPHDE